VDFPVSPVVVGSLSAATDAFVVKVSPGGTAIVWATFLGGPGYDAGEGIAVNGVGEAVVVGGGSEGFPEVVPPEAPPGDRPTFPGRFVAKLAADGRSLVLSRSLGLGSNGTSVALDASGDAYVGGSTIFETPLATPGAHRTERSGYSDVFVTKIDGGTGDVVWSTFLGSAGAEYAERIAVDAAGSAYVCGDTRSAATFPATARYSPPSAELDADAFAAKLSPDGASLAWAATWAGRDADAIAVDADGAAFVVGTKTKATFPVTVVPRGTERTAWGAYVMKIAPDGAAPEWSTILTGRDPPAPGSETTGPGASARDVAVDATGDVTVLGYAQEEFGPPYSLDEHLVFGSFVARLSADGRVLRWAVPAGVGDPVAMSQRRDGTTFLLGDRWSSFRVAGASQILAGTNLLQDVHVAKLNPHTASLVLRRGDAWDGPGAKDRVRAVFRHGLARRDEAFDPRREDVVFSIGTGGNLRTLTIPAGDRGWRRTEGGVAWQSPEGPGPRWRVAFSGRSAAAVLLREADLELPLENPFVTDVGVGARRGSELRFWRPSRTRGPVHHSFP
jgi:hypothetical protein